MLASTISKEMQLRIALLMTAMVSPVMMLALILFRIERINALKIVTLGVTLCYNMKKYGKFIILPFSLFTIHHSPFSYSPFFAIRLCLHAIVFSLRSALFFAVRLLKQV
jgi:hypothetical protein